MSCLAVQSVHEKGDHQGPRHCQSFTDTLVRLLNMSVVHPTLKAHVQLEDMLSYRNKVPVCFGKAKGTRAPHQHQQVIAWGGPARLSDPMLCNKLDRMPLRSTPLDKAPPHAVDESRGTNRLRSLISSAPEYSVASELRDDPLLFPDLAFLATFRARRMTRLRTCFGSNPVPAYSAAKGLVAAPRAWRPSNLIDVELLDEVPST